MRILQVIQKEQRRGAEIFACQLSQYLRELGHTVDILVLFGDASNDLAEFAPLSFLYGDENAGWTDYSLYKRFYFFLAERNYDLVQANAGDTLRVAAISKSLFGWRSKLIFRNANKMSAFVSSGLKRSVYKWILKQVDSVASVSLGCKTDFNELFPGFVKPVEYLPIGVEAISGSQYKSFGDARLPIEFGPVFIHVGSFVAEKNHLGLLRIFQRLLAFQPEAKLLLVGDGPLKQSIQLAVEKQNLNNVIFTGSRSDVISILPLCTSLLLPSLVEGLPGVILEAFYSKVPVIAYDVGGISEVVINYKTGYLVRLNDENEFVKKTVECLAAQERMIIENAYSLVLKEFALENVAHKFERFYLSSIATN